MAGVTLESVIAATEWYKTWQGWLSVAIAGVGGGGVVALGVAAWTSKFFADKAIETKKAELNQETERLKSELSKTLEYYKGDIARETEAYKAKLKWIEFLQGKRAEAVLAYAELNKNIQPKQSEYEESFDEACHTIAMNLTPVEEKLEAYLSQYEPFISEENAVDIQSCCDTAGMHKFPDGGDYDIISIEAISSVGDMLNKMKAVRDRMVRELRLS